METLTDDQMWVWNKWPDLQKAFPDVTINENSLRGYMEWWRVYFPMEMSARLCRPTTKVSRDNFLIIPPNKARVLVMTPITEEYDTYWDEYWESIQQLEGDFDILIIENSDTPDYYNRLCERIKNNTIHTTCIKYWHDPKFYGVGFWEMQEKLAKIHNYARLLLLSGMYSHILSIEADVTTEPLALMKLLAAKQPVVQAPILRDGQVLHGIFTNYPSPRDMTVSALQMKHLNMAGTELIKVDWGSLGCCLIERGVLENIAFRHNPLSKQHDDMWFAVDCKNYDVPMYLYPTVKVRHMKGG